MSIYQKMRLFRFPPDCQVRSMLHTGIVISEKAVEKTTSFVPNFSSQWYLDARILVVAPAGMPARRTLTPVTRSGSFKSRQGTS